MTIDIEITLLFLLTYNYFVIASLGSFEVEIDIL